MNPHERPFENQMPDFEAGSRPSIHQEVGSRFDEAYETLMSSLDGPENAALYALIGSLPEAAKERLAAALNHNGYDWGFLGTLGPANSAAAAQRVRAWAEETERAADAQAEREAGKALVHDLYEL